MAELCNQYLAKGRQVYLEGRLQTRQWQDKDGQTKYTTEIQAQTVQFLGANGAQAGGGEGRPSRDNGAPGPGPEFGLGEPANGGASTFTEDDIPF